MRRTGFAPTEEELTAIIRRIDVSADANCSYAEFEEALRPVVLEEFEQYSRSSAPKLANPSRVKLENLSKGGYLQTDETNFEAKSGSPYKSAEKPRKYNPEEIPISKSYYERKY